MACISGDAYKFEEPIRVAEQIYWLVGRLQNALVKKAEVLLD